MSPRLWIFEGAHVGQVSGLTSNDFRTAGLRLVACASESGTPVPHSRSLKGAGQKSHR